MSRRDRFSSPALLESWRATKAAPDHSIATSNDVGFKEVEQLIEDNKAPRAANEIMANWGAGQRKPKREPPEPKARWQSAEQVVQSVAFDDGVHVFGKEVGGEIGRSLERFSLIGTSGTFVSAGGAREPGFGDHAAKAFAIWWALTERQRVVLAGMHAQIRFAEHSARGFAEKIRSAASRGEHVQAEEAIPSFAKGLTVADAKPHMLLAIALDPTIAPKEGDDVVSPEDAERGVKPGPQRREDAARAIKAEVKEALAVFRDLLADVDLSDAHFHVAVPWLIPPPKRQREQPETLMVCLGINEYENGLRMPCHGMLRHIDPRSLPRCTHCGKPQRAMEGRRG